jgi:hypothetical protein
MDVGIQQELQAHLNARLSFGLVIGDVPARQTENRQKEQKFVIITLSPDQFT